MEGFRKWDSESGIRRLSSELCEERKVKEAELEKNSMKQERKVKQWGPMEKQQCFSPWIRVLKRGYSGGKLSLTAQPKDISIVS